MTGSHIDTVPQGGPLDGALGVLAGLECLQTISEGGVATRRPLTVVAWSDEEGRYGSLFGSRCFTGRMDPEVIPTLAAADGERLVDVMARAGFNALDAPKARCDPRELSAYVDEADGNARRLQVRALWPARWRSSSSGATAVRNRWGSSRRPRCSARSR